MKDLVALHKEYHPNTQLACDECLVPLDGVTCQKCGQVYDICPECYRQVCTDSTHRCVFTARQRQERKIADVVWASLGGSDDYV